MAKLDFTNKKNPFETQEEQTSNIEIKPNKDAAIISKSSKLYFIIILPYFSS